MAFAITDSNYDAVLAQGKPVVIDFWAEWCGPCRMIGPIIDQLAEQYQGRAVVGKCDVDTNGDVAARFGVRNIPTVVFLKDGQPVDRQVGYASMETLAAKIDSIL